MSDKRLAADLRQRFYELGQDVPDRARIESRVLSLTEVEEDRSLRPAAQIVLLAAVLLLAAVVGSWLERRDSGLVIETGPTDREQIASRQATTPPGTRVESEILPLSLILPETVSGLWVPVSETSSRLTFALADETDPRPTLGDPTVRIVVSAGDPASTIANGLLRDLFDVDIVGDRPAVLGGFDGRQMKLTTRAGTDTVGFRLGTGVYVSASGIDRRYLIHLVEIEGATLVLWFDAASTEFDALLLEADRLFSSIELDQ